MTDSEIIALKSGDVILIERGSRSYLRTVIQGPGDEINPPDHCSMGVYVPIRRRSWTGRINTILDRQFLRTNASTTGIRAKKAMGGDELSRLIDSGFNVSKEIVRELRERAERKASSFFPPRIAPDRCRAITAKLTKAAREYRHLLTP